MLPQSKQQSFSFHFNSFQKSQATDCGMYQSYTFMFFFKFFVLAYDKWKFYFRLKVILNVQKYRVSLPHTIIIKIKSNKTELDAHRKLYLSIRFDSEKYLAAIFFIWHKIKINHLMKAVITTSRFGNLWPMFFSRIGYYQIFLTHKTVLPFLYAQNSIKRFVRTYVNVELDA
jgi:hypothetical protein